MVWTAWAMAALRGPRPNPSIPAPFPVVGLLDPLHVRARRDQKPIQLATPLLVGLEPQISSVESQQIERDQHDRDSLTCPPCGPELQGRELQRPAAQGDELAIEHRVRTERSDRSRDFREPTGQRFGSLPGLQ